MCLVLVAAFALTPLPAEARSTKAWLADVSAIAAELDLGGSPITPPAPSKVKRSECKVCNGTGRVKTGDGISWTECENCVPDSKSKTTSRVCRCGDDCDCSAGGDNCGCIDESKPVSPTAAAIHEALGALIDDEKASSDGGATDGDMLAMAPPLVAGEPVRNAGRLAVGTGEAVTKTVVGAGRVLVRGGKAAVVGAAKLMTARYRARREYGGPCPLLRKWIDRRRGGGSGGGGSGGGRKCRGGQCRV